MRLLLLDLKSSSFLLGVIPRTPRHLSSIVKELPWAVGGWPLGIPNGLRLAASGGLGQIGERGTHVGDLRGLSSTDGLMDYTTLQKGGDPAAGSPTATLLRLRPSH